jgi:hypothetical protein
MKEFFRFIERNGLEVPLGIGMLFILLAIAARIAAG